MKSELRHDAENYAIDVLNACDTAEQFMNLAYISRNEAAFIPVRIEDKRFNVAVSNIKDRLKNIKIVYAGLRACYLFKDDTSCCEYGPVFKRTLAIVGDDNQISKFQLID